MDASPIISCSLNLFVKQVESLAHLCVDYESSKLRIEAWKVLNEMLTRLKNAEKGKLVSDSATAVGDKHPSWLIELAHGKIFSVSETLSNPAFTETMFHEEKTLEKHLASLHAFLNLLKAIEDSR